jgi:quinol-cytochrome oxidoreductase complex cytochrome b subunit
LFGLGVFLIIFCGVVFFSPEFFIEADNNIPANPMETPTHIVPEWYFLPFYAILRAIPDKLGGVIAMALSILIFAVMPFLDRCKVPGGARYRPIYRIMVYAFIIDVVVLGYVGKKPPGGMMTTIGELATFIYFAIFAVLPFTSQWENRLLVHSNKLPEEALQLISEEREDLERHGKQA